MKTLEYYCGKSETFDDIINGIKYDLSTWPTDRGEVFDWEKGNWPPKKIEIKITIEDEK